MTRLSSYSSYVVVFFLSISGIGATIQILINRPAESPLLYFAWLPFLLLIIYNIYTSKRVYYNGSDLLLYNLFSEKCLVIDKAKLIDIEKRRWYQTRGSRVYRINYVDDNNNSKHLDFEMSSSIDDPEDLVDKINSVD